MKPSKNLFYFIIIFYIKERIYLNRMNILQQNLFNLLTEFDDICKKYDINYFLAAGTALGAVRHHRFLPWDDDMDLYITRDNWNKLRNVLETEENVLPKGRSFVYHENTKYYRNPIPRYVNNETTTIYKTQSLAGKACGQHLELLILDPMPKDEEEQQEFIDLLRVYTEILSPFFVVCRNLSLEEWEKHYKLYQEYYERAENEGDEKILQELSDKLQNYSLEESDRYCMRWGNVIYTYNKEHLEESRIGLFEGREFPISKYAETMLRIAYGDSWMYVPEVEDQVVRSPITNLSMPFKEYTSRYLEKINREEVLKKYRILKHGNANMFYKRRKVDYLVAKVNVNVESKEIIKDLNKKEEYLCSLLEEKDYESILAEFNDFCNLQLRRDVKKYNIFVPISKRNLKTLLLCFIEKGQYFDGNRYLKIYKNQDGTLDDELIEIENLINICRELSIARYDKKDVELVQRLVDKYEESYPDLLDIYRAKIWIMENKAKTEEDYKEIDELCGKALELYPFDGEIMAIQAKAKLDCGKKEEAMNLYNKAIYNTRNGIIWQKVEDEVGISRTDIERDLIEGLEDEN